MALFDMLGYGLSDKPDIPYDMGLQADLAMALVEALGWDRLGLLTHDVGDTVGGELLARQLEGGWDVEVVDRTLTNGSIYLELAHLSAGQLLLLELPDARLDGPTAPDRETVVGAITATFSPATQVDQEEAAAQWQMMAHAEGQRLLPRLIRYIEERRGLSIVGCVSQAITMAFAGVVDAALVPALDLFGQTGSPPRPWTNCPASATCGTTTGRLHWPATSCSSSWPASC